MSKHSAPQFESIIIDANNSAFSIENNKYFRPIIMSYYMNTRQVNYIEAVKFFHNFEITTPEIDKLISEYIIYISGGTIVEGNIDNKFILCSPKYKANSIQSYLEMKLNASFN